MRREFWIEVMKGMVTNYYAYDHLPPKTTIYVDEVVHVQEVTPGEKSFTREEFRAAVAKVYDGNTFSYLENELFGAGGDV